MGGSGISWISADLQMLHALAKYVNFTSEQIVVLKY